MRIKTRKEVREEFARRGISFASWARENGFSSGLVTEILGDSDAAPRRKCLRGESHDIAVALGLKRGEISRPISRRRLATA